MPNAALRIACTFLLSVAACSRGGTPERLTIGTARLPAYGLVFIAEAKGYFAAQGLAVDQRRYTSGRDALAALGAGEVDAATSAVTPVARAATADLAVLTMLHSSSRNARLVARADAGIAREEDLAGKRIGVPRSTSAEYFLHTLLAFGGVAPDAVEILDVAPEAAVDAIVSGEVDAVAIWPPLSNRARRVLGTDLVVELGCDAYTEISVLTARDATYRERRPALAKLLRALAEAERLVRERPEEAFQALRSEFAELSEAELRDAWGRIDPALGVTHELAAVLERESAWLRDTARVSAPPPEVAALLEAGLLAEVDQEAVTFVAPLRPDETG